MMKKFQCFLMIVFILFSSLSAEAMSEDLASTNGELNPPVIQQEDTTNQENNNGNEADEGNNPEEQPQDEDGTDPESKKDEVEKPLESPAEEVKERT